jgi:Tfp pilus assembly protein PilE
MKSPLTAPRGFTSVELLLVVALSAIVLGGAVVTYGTIVRNQPRLSSVVTVNLGASAMSAFYGVASSTFDTPVAPNFTGLSRAEELREAFISDTMSATAVFCLGRDAANTYKPSVITYDPTVHGELDTPQAFRSHLIATGGPSTLYRDYRNPLGLVADPPCASIYILGYSKFAGYLKVNAIYDIDVVPFTTAEPLGFHASVKRYADPTGATTFTTLVFAGSYEVFYPPSDPKATAGNYASTWSTDGFVPLFVTFERSVRLALLEGTTTDRFKRAAERPFYFIWWPDPCARNLGRPANTLPSPDPRHAYNHMAGRTSFMFTVPMFPCL